MNAINVDNEYFYSDHIISRVPDILGEYEFKRSILCALPSEYKPLHKGK